MSEKSLRLGILASHGGTNLQAIMDACKQGHLDAEVCLVISNNSDSMALNRAKSDDVKCYHFSGKTHPTPEELDVTLTDTLESHNVDVVVLAGYMKLLGNKTLARYRNRVLNSHPALLPEFGGKGMYGSHVHEAVLRAGEKTTGVTIHLVDEVYDHGATVAQCEVPVLEGDNLEALEERVKVREREFWVEILQKIAHGEIDLDKVTQQSVPSI